MIGTSKMCAHFFTKILWISKMSQISGTATVKFCKWQFFELHIFVSKSKIQCLFPEYDAATPFAYLGGLIF